MPVPVTRETGGSSIQQVFFESGGFHGHQGPSSMGKVCIVSGTIHGRPSGTFPVWHWHGYHAPLGPFSKRYRPPTPGFYS